MRRKLILRNHQSPGDIVMLTAGVRDLKRALGDAVAVDVRTPCPALWENNPYRLRWRMTTRARRGSSAGIH